MENEVEKKCNCGCSYCEQVEETTSQLLGLMGNMLQGGKPKDEESSEFMQWGEWYTDLLSHSESIVRDGMFKIASMGNFKENN